MGNSMVRKQSTATLLCLLCGIPLIATSAIEAPGAERAVKVSVADLNLVDEQGITKLYQRLQRASRKVCGSADFVTAGSLKQRQLNQRCYHETLQNAVQDFGNAKLKQLHADSNRLP
jgi:UrcA family protein